MIVTVKIDEQTRHALRFIAAVTGLQQQQVADQLIQQEAKRLGWHMQTLKSEEPPLKPSSNNMER